MQTVLPKMGAPLRVMTPDGIAAERDLFIQAGYNVSRRARELGIKRGALAHHLRDLLSAQSLRRGKVPPTVGALIDAGNALFDAAPKSAITLRQNWILARMAVTQRRPSKQAANERHRA